MAINTERRLKCSAAADVVCLMECVERLRLLVHWLPPPSVFSLYSLSPPQPLRRDVSASEPRGQPRDDHSAARPAATYAEGLQCRLHDATAN
jgi:hypothetical protein